MAVQMWILGIPTRFLHLKKRRKKRTVVWPHKFAPGSISSVDYNKLELPDQSLRCTSQVSHVRIVRTPHGKGLHLLKGIKCSFIPWSHCQTGWVVALGPEWTSLSEICEKVNTYLMHSDLHSSQLRPNMTGFFSSPNVSPSHNQRLPTKPEADKPCRPWNYYGSCSWDEANLEPFNAFHECRLCATPCYFAQSEESQFLLLIHRHDYPHWFPWKVTSPFYWLLWCQLWINHL